MGSKFKTLLENENLEKIKNISKVLKSSKSVVLSRCSYESWSTWLYRHWGSRLHLIALISYLFILGFSHSIKCNSDGLIEPYKLKLTNKLCYLNGTFRYTCDGLLTIPRMEEGYTERCSLQEEPERLWKYTYFKRLLFIQVWQLVIVSILNTKHLILFSLLSLAQSTSSATFLRCTRKLPSPKISLMTTTLQCKWCRCVVSLSQFSTTAFPWQHWSSFIYSSVWSLLPPFTTQYSSWTATLMDVSGCTDGMPFSTTSLKAITSLMIHCWRWVKSWREGNHCE